MIKRKWLSFILLLFVFQSIALCADDNQISMQSEVDRNSITIGDYINYKIILDYDSDIKVTPPGLGANLGMFEIKDYNVIPEKEVSGRIKKEFTYKISTYTTGEYTIPGITVEYFVLDKKKQIVSNPIKIEVVTVSKDGKLADIKDVKPLYIPEFSYKKIIIISSIVLLLIIIAIIIYIKKRNRISNEVQYVDVIIDYFKDYLDRLETVEENLENLDIKELYFTIDDIFRQYFSIYIDEVVMEMTTYEIVKKYSSKLPADVDRKAFSEIKNFMEHADMVKFAKFPETQKQAESDIKFIRNFINEYVVEPVKGKRIKGGNTK